MEEKSNVIFDIKVDFYNQFDKIIHSFKTDDEKIAEQKINDYIKNKKRKFKYFTIYAEVFDTYTNRILKKSIDYIYKEDNK